MSDRRDIAGNAVVVRLRGEPGIDEAPEIPQMKMRVDHVQIGYGQGRRHGLIGRPTTGKIEHRTGRK